jgi:hypothetical protein
MATKKAPAKKSSPKKTNSVKTSSPMLMSDRKWEAQDALRTLKRAQEIQANTKLMSLVKQEAKSQMATIAKIAK